jgi:hypothetical protein
MDCCSEVAFIDACVETAERGLSVLEQNDVTVAPPTTFVVTGGRWCCCPRDALGGLGW